MIKKLAPMGIAAVLFILSLQAYAQQDQAAGVSKRAEMTGVSEHAIHHFQLLKDGGTVTAEVKDPKDTAGRNQLRLHMAHMARTYAEGYFRGPEFIHAQTIPGVVEMKELKDEIRYQYQDTDSGGRITIVSHNEKAIAAVHDFLRFEIKNHRTGDSTEVK